MLFQLILYNKKLYKQVYSKERAEFNIIINNAYLKVTILDEMKCHGIALIYINMNMIIHFLMKRVILDLLEKYNEKCNYLAVRVMAHSFGMIAKKNSLGPNCPVFKFFFFKL